MDSSGIQALAGCNHSWTHDVAKNVVKIMVTWGRERPKPVSLTSRKVTDVYPPCPGAGQPGSASSTTWWPGDGSMGWPHAAQMLLLASVLEIRGSTSSTCEAPRVTGMWALLWCDTEVLTTAAEVIGGVSRDFGGGGVLSAALWLLWASFFISSLFVF